MFHNLFALNTLIVQTRKRQAPDDWFRDGNSNLAREIAVLNVIVLCVIITSVWLFWQKCQLCNNIH